MASSGRFLIALLLAAAPAQAQDAPPASVPKPPSPEEEVAAVGLGKTRLVELEPRTSTPDTRGPVSTHPTPAELSAAPPTTFAAEPHYASDAPRYFHVRVAQTGRVNFVLDKSDPASRIYDLLYADRNGDRDLSNDGPPLKGRWTHADERGRDYCEFTPVTVDAYHSEGAAGGGSNAPAPFTIYAWYPRDGELGRVYCTSAGWQQAAFKLERRNVAMALFDDDNDGAFELATCRWSLVDLETGAQLMAKENWRPSNVPFRIGGVPYAIGSVSPDGRRAELRSQTERDAFQAEISFDPTFTEPPRPRSERAIEWGSDLDVAFEVATLKKQNVFLLVSVPWVDSARLLEERTLADKEVVELAEQFVCVQANPDFDPAIGARFGVEACPTMLILDGSGGVLDRVIGYRDARTLCEVLRRFR